jgi:hypothetical protein
MKDSGNLITILEPLKLKEENNKLVTIQNARLVASYNWLDRNEPTILVPGLLTIPT